MTSARTFVSAGLALILAVAIAVGPAIARQPTEPEKLALKKTIEAFIGAQSRRDFETVVSLLPPAVLSHAFEMAKGSGGDIFGNIQDPDESVFRKVLAIEIHKTMEGVRLVSFTMDAARAEYREVSDGTPFALVPTTTSIDLGPPVGKIITRTYTLGHLQDGKWFLMSVDDLSNVAILRRVYPAYSGIEFPSGSNEAMKE